MRDYIHISPEAELFNIESDENIDELYELYTQKAILCPSLNFNLERFRGMMRAFVANSAHDIWVLEDKGQILYYIVTTLENFTLRIVISVLHKDLDQTEAISDIITRFVEIARNSGCTSLHWLSHKQAPNQELLGKLGHKLEFKKYTTDDDFNEYELKV